MIHAPLGPPVVVGVDGSVHALDAARWAVREAARRRCRLRVVHALTWPVERHVTDYTAWETYLRGVLARAHRHVDEAVAAARSTAPGVDVAGDLRVGSPVELLLEESRSACLVVVAARGLGALVELLVGSTAAALAAHGHCPVVVVPPAARPAADQPVVVGVDHSAAGEAAVEFAFDAAVARGTRLVAVHAYSDLTVTADRLLPALRLTPDWRRVEVEQQQLLAEHLAAWHDKYPEVPVQQVITMGRPAHSLLEHASAACLLVVGRRGRGGFAGMVMGSTSDAVLRHCPCPVAVVRPNPA
jgi:nucleotide-binding universal stress UspA family protein